jgi:hypothetical protein
MLMFRLERSGGNWFRDAREEFDLVISGAGIW